MLDQTQPLSDESQWAEWRAFVQTVTSAPAIFVVDAALSYTAVYPLPAYTGTYAQEDPDGTDGTLEGRLEQDRLVLYQPGMRLGPLVPLSATRLHLVATPVDVEFMVEEGRAQRLVLLWSSGKALAFQRI